MEFKKYYSELLGTFALVFFGTGSVIVNTQFGGDLGLLGISLSFGIIVTAIIYMFGSISGAHINPAVTLAFALDGKISKKETCFYIISQVLGAIIASILLKILFPESIGLGQTLPTGSLWQSLIIEIIMTFFLMMTILGITEQGNNNTKALAGIIIGGFIVMAILIAGPISGGSFNPARSIAPALVIGNLSHIWIYLVGPVLGSISAIYIWRKLKYTHIK